MRDSHHDQTQHEAPSVDHQALELARSAARASYEALSRTSDETEVCFELDASFPGDAMRSLLDSCREQGWIRNGYEMYRAPQWLHDLCQHYLVYGHPDGETVGREFPYPSIGAVVPVPKDPGLQELMRSDGLSEYSLSQLSAIVASLR